MSVSVCNIATAHQPGFLCIGKGRREKTNPVYLGTEYFGHYFSGFLCISIFLFFFSLPLQQELYVRWERCGSVSASMYVCMFVCMDHCTLGIILNGMDGSMNG